MKTGGTTVGVALHDHYGDEARYPDSRWEAVLGQKWSCDRFLAQPSDRLAELRWISVHLPLGVALRHREFSESPVDIVCLLRDGTERAISHLLQISRRLQHRYSYRELLDTPLVGDFFLSNHQVRALGVDRSGWSEWDRCFEALMDLPGYMEKPDASVEVSAVDQEQFERAGNSLESVDELGLQSHFDDWWRRCAVRFGWPVTPGSPVNVGADRDGIAPPPIPDDIIDELRERNALDRALYTTAAALLSQRS